MLHFHKEISFLYVSRLQKKEEEVKRVIREYIEKTLAPRIQGDGGWVEYVSLEGDQLTLIFRGECSKCEILDRCENWIADKIREDLGETVKVNGIRRKPFFWDKQ